MPEKHKIKPAWFLNLQLHKLARCNQRQRTENSGLGEMTGHFLEVTKDMGPPGGGYIFAIASKP